MVICAARILMVVNDEEKAHLDLLYYEDLVVFTCILLQGFFFFFFMVHFNGNGNLARNEFIHCLHHYCFCTAAT